MPTSQGNIDAQVSEHSIVRLNKDNLADVAKLHAEVYPVAQPLNYFQKKYDTAFTKIENVGFLAYDKDQRPAAYYGVIPCFIQFGDKIVLAAQSGDTMTHPRHRGKGLVVKLSNITFDLCKELGIQLLFGFPNQDFYPIMIKHLQWKETEKLNRFEVRVNRSLKRFLFKTSQERKEAILLKMLLSKNGIGNSVIADGFGGISKDEAFFNYKTFSKTYVLKISGAEVWVKITDQLIIGDVNIVRKDPLLFFSEIKALAKKLGVAKISFQASPGCSMHDFFAAHYKPIPSFPVLFQDFGSGIPIEKIKFTFSDIDIF